MSSLFGPLCIIDNTNMNDIKIKSSNKLNLICYRIYALLRGHSVCSSIFDFKNKNCWTSGSLFTNAYSTGERQQT